MSVQLNPPQAHLATAIAALLVLAGGCDLLPFKQTSRPPPPIVDIGGLGPDESGTSSWNRGPDAQGGDETWTGGGSWEGGEGWDDGLPWDDQDVEEGAWQDVPTTIRNPSRFPGFSAALAIGNDTGLTRVVRIRHLRSTVTADCAAIAKAPHLALSRKLFQPAQAWIVQSGRAIPLNPPATPPGQCKAALIDGTGFGLRLVFWLSGTYGVKSLPSTVQGAAAGRLLRIASGEGEATLTDHPALYPAPPVFDIWPTPGCAQPKAADGVVWTTPLPASNNTIVALDMAPDGCAKMDLLGKTGIATWFLCVPPGAFPFAVGDTFSAAPIFQGHNFGAVEGVELMTAGKRIRAGVGVEPVYFGKGETSVEPTQGCHGQHEACGALAMPLKVSITPPGASTFAALQGKALDLGPGRTLWVLRARELVVADTACVDAAAAGRRVESVYTEVIQ